MIRAGGGDHACTSLAISFGVLCDVASAEGADEVADGCGGFGRAESSRRGRRWRCRRRRRRRSARRLRTCSALEMPKPSAMGSVVNCLRRRTSVFRVGGELGLRAGDADARDGVDEAARVLGDGAEAVVGRGGRGEEDGREVVLAHDVEVFGGFFDDHVGEENAVGACGFCGAARTLRGPCG